MRRIILGLTALLFSIPSVAAESQFDSTHTDWSVFTADSGANKVCYTTTAPKKSDGNFKKRGEPYLLVTVRKDGTAEVSTSSGYPYKSGSTVDVAIDKTTTFKLFTTDETPEIAWARSADDDKKIIASMKKGSKLTAKGYSRKGSYSVDSYSLAGFTSAYNKITSLCK